MNIQTLTPHQRLCAAISIIQREILARDSALIPEKMFGKASMADPALELANSLLVELLPDVEGLEARP